MANLEKWHGGTRNEMAKSRLFEILRSSKIVP